MDGTDQLPIASGSHLAADAAAEVVEESLAVSPAAASDSCEDCGRTLVNPY